MTEQRVPQGWWRYILAVALVAAALAVTLVLKNAYSTVHWFVFVAAVMASAWFGGAGPGWLSVVLSAAGVVYLLVPPLPALGGARGDLPIFVAAGVFAAANLFVTSRRQAEGAIKQEAEEALQQVRADLARMTRVTLMGELTATIAHDVNQPLAAITSNGAAALRWLDRDTPDVGAARAAMQRIIRDADRASAVIKRIRALLEKSPPERSVVDVNDVLGEVLALVRDELRRHHIVVRTELSTGVTTVLGDRVALQQLLLNLIMNAIEAIRAAPEGPRELVVASEATAGEPGTVGVTVRDSGIGIAADSIEKVFTPFYTTKPNGMGMGLGICRSIAEAHGGRLWAESGAGVGTTFHCAIPVATSAADA